MVKKKLTFEPTIFRDWSIIYCELAQISAVKEFKRQFGWGYSDLIFLWDGKKETLYRAKEEHIYGMFNFIKKKIQKEKDFIKKISQKLLNDIREYKKLLEKWLIIDFYKLDKNQVFLIFNQLKSQYLPILPRFLIIMYFPQQIEQYYSNYKKKFEKDFKICLRTRPKVDKILAPITEELLRKIGSFALKISNFQDYEKYRRFLTIEEAGNLFQDSYTKKQIVKLKKELMKREKYFLFAGGGHPHNRMAFYMSEVWCLRVYKQPFSPNRNYQYGN